MIYLVVVLSITVCVLLTYNWMIRREIGRVSHQLEKRVTEDTRQIITVELISKNLNRLVKNVNRSLKAEENLRLKAFRNEKEFKELITNISHDLRTPLTAIKGYIQLLDNSDMDEKQRKKLDIVQTHTEHLERLIGDFFEYSYLLNAEPKCQIERINITNLVIECLASSVQMFEEKNITVNVTSAEPVIVDIDKELTIRIIQNLIKNCVMHSDGDVEVQIISKERAEVHFINSVNDASEIDVDKLFDRFYTSDKSRNKSTGLGLSIVKLLVEQMGGTVSASLQNGKIHIMVLFKNWSH